MANPTPATPARPFVNAPDEQRACSLEVIGLSKHFGDLIALDDVSLRVPAGSFHALLGENGAGKSTLVKCIVGYQQPDAGNILVDDRERLLRNPREASAVGIGMVYQHFTLVPHMTVAENLVISRTDTPQFIDWRHATRELNAFMETMPFRIPLDAPAASLAAGEKQKVEILRQLYLKRRFLILDEPTSVLTPEEADEVLGLLQSMTQRGEITVLMITHKLREVKAFTESVSVLRGGAYVGGGQTVDLETEDLAELMVGERDARASRSGGHHQPGKTVLSIEAMQCRDDEGVPAVRDVSLSVRRGEIVGIVGVSGNGQKELVEVLAGQREPEGGQMTVNGAPYTARRAQMVEHGIAILPEEPLRNSCVGSMSVADNMAFRSFDRTPHSFLGWLFHGPRRSVARELIERFSVSTPGPDTPISQLSGGNVQRAVLARELTGDVRLLIAANPVFGLDFKAVQEVHDRLREARAAGAAVLLISEDLDEVLQLSDRIVVMFEGSITHQTDSNQVDVTRIGQAMAGQQS